MKVRYISHLLTMAALAGILAACAGAQAPATIPVAPTPAATTESAATVAPEAAPQAVTEVPTEERLEESTEAQALAAERVAVEALEPAECEAIRMAVTDRLGVEFQTAEMDFDSEIANRQGTACAITALGTGEDFGHSLDVDQTLREVLEAEGWSENQAYLADGPTGTAFGYEKEGQFAMAHVNWIPAEDAECPDDQPISACELEPSQQIFTVMLQLMQTS